MPSARVMGKIVQVRANRASAIPPRAGHMVLEHDLQLGYGAGAEGLVGDVGERPRCAGTRLTWVEREVSEG